MIEQTVTETVSTEESNPQTSAQVADPVIYTEAQKEEALAMLYDDNVKEILNGNAEYFNYIEPAVSPEEISDYFVRLEKNEKTPKKELTIREEDIKDKSTIEKIYREICTTKPNDELAQHTKVFSVQTNSRDIIVIAAETISGQTLIYIRAASIRYPLLLELLARLEGKQNV